MKPQEDGQRWRTAAGEVDVVLSSQPERRRPNETPWQAEPPSRARISHLLFCLLNGFLSVNKSIMKNQERFNYGLTRGWIMKYD